MSAQEDPGPSEAIHYRDIGKRFYIEGEFGKVYTDFEIRGTVLKPTGKGDASGKVRLEITHIRGEKIKERRTEYVVTDSEFEVGSEVVLVVREEARLWYPEGIDAIVSSPDRSHLNKLHCVVSLHLRKILSSAGTNERTEPRPETKESEQVEPRNPP